MSVASEIERIQLAKETLKTKLNSKNDEQHQITNETLEQFGDFCDSILTPSGTINITENGTVDVTNYASADVNVSGSGGKNTQAVIGMYVRTFTNYLATGLKLTVNKTGTYKVTWLSQRLTAGGTNGTALYIDGTLYGSKRETWGMNFIMNLSPSPGQSPDRQYNIEEHVNLTEGQVVEIYSVSGSTGNWVISYGLVIEEE